MSLGMRAVFYPETTRSTPFIGADVELHVPFADHRPHDHPAIGSN
jgi:hypothetical protein